MTVVVLIVVWLLILAAIIEAGISNLVMAVRTFKAMFDEPGGQGA